MMLGPRPPNEGPLSFMRDPLDWSQGVLKGTSMEKRAQRPSYSGDPGMGRLRHCGPHGFLPSSSSGPGVRVPHPGCAVKSPRGPRPGLCTPQAGRLPESHRGAPRRPPGLQGRGSGGSARKPAMPARGPRTPCPRPAPLPLPAAAHTAGSLLPAGAARRPRRSEEGPARR